MLCWYRLWSNIWNTALIQRSVWSGCPCSFRPRTEVPLNHTGTANVHKGVVIFLSEVNLMSEFAFATPLAFRIDLLPPASLPQPATPNVPTTHPRPLYTLPGGDNNSVPINQELLLVPGVRPRHRSLTRTLGGRNHFSLQVKKLIRGTWLQPVRRRPGMRILPVRSRLSLLPESPCLRITVSGTGLV